MATGALKGQLVERDGCLFWDAGEQGENVPLWPSQFTLSGTDSPIVRSDRGDEIHVGDVATLGGGERGRKGAEEMIGEQIPERCTASGYWLATEVVEEVESGS